MDTMTLEQQVQAGMRGAGPRNFVAAIPQRSIQPAPINAEIVHTIDATPNATQHVEMRTSATDRAIGFCISMLPIAALFGMTVLGVCVVGYGIPLLSIPSLIILATVFATVYTVAYLYTLHISAEGVSMFEAQEKWSTIKAEQQMRWQAWMMERES